jgi:hypothetical protein
MALNLLGRLRQMTGKEIPLAWSPDSDIGIGAIEVYPAATRVGRGVDDAEGSLVGLDHELLLPEAGLGNSSPHARDAIVCALAGADFLRGLSVPPGDKALAKKEGWIWVRR